jgi:hypothetical protein
MANRGRRPDYEPPRRVGDASVQWGARDPVVQVVVRLVICEGEDCDCGERNACDRNASDATAVPRHNQGRCLRRHEEECKVGRPKRKRCDDRPRPKHAARGSLQPARTENQRESAEEREECIGSRLLRIPSQEGTDRGERCGQDTRTPRNKLLPCRKSDGYRKSPERRRK